MKVTIVVDNYCARSDLIAEYGLSMHIKTNNEEEILFDTGQGLAFFYNAEKLGVDLKKITSLVLSHGHFDHVWGALKVLEKTGNIPVWAHPSFDQRRYRNKFGNSQYIGSYIKKEDVNFNPIKGLTKIIDDVWAIDVPCEKRNVEYTPVTNHLQVDSGGEWKIDSFPDDISLLVKGEKGYSIILGCAHAGVANILQEISENLGIKKFYTVIGGMHMLGQSKDFVEAVVNKIIREYEVELWVPTHCTGFEAAALLNQKTNRVKFGGTGISIDL